jgi:hypothetical protein
MYEIVDADLQPIIRGLKRAFVRKKRETGNQHFRLNTKNSKTEDWVRAAELLRENGAHPDDWVEAAFTYATNQVFVTTLLLLGLIVMMNASAIYVRNRLKKKYAGSQF